ncbi:FAD-dependent oxidoreductase (plasmid) [Pelagibacterium sp. H642]|nr:FAD-dependent oxidoreductase [Pelagibacterium sp. H642]
MREEETEGTTTFHFERPAGFQFKAGQAIYLTLPASIGADNRGRMRTFSLSSSPHDRDLTITTRVSDSAFKKALQALPLGTEIELSGPYGNMVLDERRPAVFIAGGIGITPFRSMIRDAIERGLRQRMVVFYSVRKAEDAAFVGELEALAEHNPRFELVPTITGPGEVPPGWQRGKVTNEMISRHAGDLADQTFYVAGPPKMVEGLKQMLLASGVATADFHIEEFTGY